MSIASLARSSSGQNVKIGQAGVGTQVTDGFVTMDDAMLVGIGLVYPIVVILIYLLLVPLLTFVALPLVVIRGFVSLAATGRTLDLSALIGLRMLRGIVITNAIGRPPPPPRRWAVVAPPRWACRWASPWPHRWA